MKLGHVVDRCTHLWRSPAVTVVCVGLFGVLVARGLWLGAAQRRDVDFEAGVCLHYVHTTDREVSLTGRAIFSTVVDSGLGASMIGPCRLEVCTTDLEQAALRLVLSWERAGPGDAFRIVDEQTGDVRLLTELVANRCVLTIPMPRTRTALRFEPSQPRLGFRVHELELHAATAPAFAIEDRWVEVQHDENGRTSIGSGFWRDALDGRLPTRNCAWLRVDPAAPGPHRLRLQFGRPDPGVSMPIVTLGGRRIWSVAEGTSVWGRATTVDGVTEVELEVDLAATNVVSIEAPGPVRSALERGVGSDPCRVAYWLFVSGCRVVPK